MGLDCNRAARSRSANNRRAPRSSRPTSRASWPKPFTTRTPVTVSSTCCAMSAARCCADQVAGNSLRRDYGGHDAQRGTTTSAISVSSGESHSMATTDTATSTIIPKEIGTIDSRPCTS